MIKSAKKAIYGILGSTDITDKELATTFAGDAPKSLLNMYGNDGCKCGYLV